MKSHFDANEQATALQSSEKCLKHTTEEYDLANDKHEFYEKLNDIERHYMLYTVGFFCSAEGWVGQNILEISKRIRNTETRMFLGYQLMEEMKHIDTFRYIMEERYQRISKLMNRHWHSIAQRTAQGTLVLI